MKSNPKPKFTLDRFSEAMEMMDNRLEKIESALTARQESEPVSKPITTKELCAFLNVTEPTVIRWRKKLVIPFYSIGSAIRYDLKKVITALEAQNMI